MKQNKKKIPLKEFLIGTTFLVFVGLGLSVYPGEGNQAYALDTSKCLELPEDLLSRMEAVMNTEGNLPYSTAVKSVTSAGDQIYHIVVEIDAPGLTNNGDYAIFAKPELNNIGPAYATDHVAAEFFGFPDFTEKLGYKASDPDGYDMAFECIKWKQSKN